MEENKQEKRDEMGRFVKGHAGGPGRGKKSDHDTVLAMAEKVLKELLQSTDDRVKLRAAHVIAKLEGAKPPEHGAPLHEDLIPFIHFATSMTDCLPESVNLNHLLFRMIEVCPGCKRLGIEWSEPIVVVNGRDGRVISE